MTTLRFIQPDANGHIPDEAFSNTPPPGWGGGGSSLPAGGATGQVLTKLSSNNGDVGWTTVSGGGNTPDALPGSMVSTAWYFPGAVSVRVSAARVAAPQIGTFELHGATLMVMSSGVGNTVSGNTTVRFSAGGSPVGTITLPVGDLSTTGWYKNSANTSRRIFLNTPNLTPETVLTCEILSLPTATVMPADLTAQLWMRWVA